MAGAARLVSLPPSEEFLRTFGNDVNPGSGTLAVEPQRLLRFKRPGTDGNAFSRSPKTIAFAIGRLEPAPTKP